MGQLRQTVAHGFRAAIRARLNGGRGARSTRLAAVCVELLGEAEVGDLWLEIRNPKSEIRSGRREAAPATDRRTHTR